MINHPLLNVRPPAPVSVKSSSRELLKKKVVQRLPGGQRQNCDSLPLLQIPRDAGPTLACAGPTTYRYPQRPRAVAPVVGSRSSCATAATPVPPCPCSEAGAPAPPRSRISPRRARGAPAMREGEQNRGRRRRDGGVADEVDRRSKRGRGGQEAAATLSSPRAP
jgi:hypothetical protein